MGVAIENMDVLEAPTLQSSARDIRAFYGDEAFAVVTSFAGALALLAYVLLAAALFGLLRERERVTDAWSTVALAGGIGGPAVAATGLAAAAVLVSSGGAELSDDVVETLFDFYLLTRAVSGVFVSLFLAGVGVAALRSATLPRLLAAAACAIAVPMALAPLAAFTADDALDLLVRIAFALQTTWIFAASVWLLLGNGVPALEFLRKAAFLLLVIAAGLVGVAMVAVPGATDKFFAWGLGPEPLAAFAGGVYVGSATAYAAGLPRGWREVRGLVAGAVVLSVSVFVITLTHDDQFEFDRLQAWAWVVLFGGFSIVTACLLAVETTGGTEQDGAALPNWVRGSLAVISVGLGALALALWIDPASLSDEAPFELSPLGGRFAGSWVALLAVLAGFAAARNRVDEARLSVLALVTLPAGALVAALRTISYLEPAGTAAGYIGVIALLLVLGLVLLGSLPRPATPAPRAAR